MYGLLCFEVSGSGIDRFCGLWRMVDDNNLEERGGTVNSDERFRRAE